MIHLLGATAYVPYPSWLNPADNTWQITAATFVGLMSLPGLAVLYASIVPKKWAVNVLAMMFAGFSLVLVSWFLWDVQARLQSDVDRRRRECGARGRHPDPERRDDRNIAALLRELHREARHHDEQLSGTGTGLVGGQHHHPVPLPDGQPGVLPVRVRGDHAPAVPGERARPHQVLGLVHPRPVLVDVRLRRRRLHALGRWLLRPGGSARLLGWVRHPHVGRSLRASWRRGCSDRDSYEIGSTPCPTTWSWRRSGPASCGSVGTGSTVETRTTPERARPRPSSTPTSPRQRVSWCGSRWTPGSPRRRSRRSSVVSTA